MGTARISLQSHAFTAKGDRRTGFYQVDNELFEVFALRRHLDVFALGVYLLLARKAERGRVVTMCCRRLCAGLGIGNKPAMKAIQRLVSVGLITVIPGSRRNQAASYQVHSAKEALRREADAQGITLMPARGCFYQADNELFDVMVPVLGFRAIVIYNLLLADAKRTGWVVTSVRDLESRLGVSKDTAQQCLGALKKARLLEEEQTSGKFDRRSYVIRDAKEAVHERAKAQPMTRRYCPELTTRPGKWNVVDSGHEVVLIQDSGVVNSGRECSQFRTLDKEEYLIQDKDKYTLLTSQREELALQASAGLKKAPRGECREESTSVKKGTARIRRTTMEEQRRVANAMIGMPTAPEARKPDPMVSVLRVLEAKYEQMRRCKDATSRAGELRSLIQAALAGSLNLESLDGKVNALAEEMADAALTSISEQEAEVIRDYVRSAVVTFPSGMSGQVRAECVRKLKHQKIVELRGMPDLSGALWS